MAIAQDTDAKRPRVLRQIAELQRLPMQELTERWRVLIGGEPPQYNKAFVLQRLICRVQELAYGGLSIAAAQQMDQMLTSMGYDALGGERDAARASTATRRNSGMPMIGTRLVREWNGQRYEVLVTHDGFEFEGRPYKSLTAIAKAITGTHWNGPHFFGLRRKQGGADE
ncbi:MAG: DUF2924 domain-containing protein [Armatimonadota bacterium]